MHSFQYSTRHLLFVVTVGAFCFWSLKNVLDSGRLAESQARLVAAKTAGSFYLYDKLLSDERVIGRKIAEYPGLDDLLTNRKPLDDRKLAEFVIAECPMVRPIPKTSQQTVSDEERATDLQQVPPVVYVPGDRVLHFSLKDSGRLPEGSTTVAFFLYVRDDKILAVFDYVAVAIN